jgi:hypothetical protein
LLTRRDNVQIITATVKDFSTGHASLRRRQNKIAKKVNIGYFSNSHYVTLYKADTLSCEPLKNLRGVIGSLQESIYFPLIQSFRTFHGGHTWQRTRRNTFLRW